MPTTAAGRKPGGRGGGVRAALRNSGVGEIVEVQGGHILRATGRKDRHSKVCTAKGPRDRRVRLAAHTAIQFYDVQDRLGYDRPSKAVDWLMKKAKAAIDELEELPAWKPTATAFDKCRTPPGDGDTAGLAEEESEGMFIGDNAGESSDLLPPSLDSDSIADTIKSFFPLNGAVSAAQQTQFQPYPPPELISRRGGDSHSQDLKLSLQSFQDPMLIGFDNSSSSWAAAAQQRMIGFNSVSGSSGGGDGGGGFMLIPPQTQQQPLLFGSNGGIVGQSTAAHLFHQRGPLQSSNTPSVRAWIGDYSIGSSSSSGQDFHQALSVHPVSLSGIGYASSSGGFPGFCIPARIQGDDEEEHDGNLNKPSSASSGSRH